MKYRDVSSPASANGAATATSSRNHRIMLCPLRATTPPPSSKRYVSTRGNQDFNRLERRASGGHREGRTPQSSIRSRDAGLPQLQQKTRANGSRSTVSPPQPPCSLHFGLYTHHLPTRRRSQLTRDTALHTATQRACRTPSNPHLVRHNHPLWLICLPYIPPAPT